jgi:hypothetical protein
MNRLAKALALTTGVLVVVSGGRLAAQSRSPMHDYVVPGHGRLSLAFPEGWKDSSEPLQQPPSVRVRIGPASTGGFDVQVTAVWLDPARLSQATADSIKAGVARSAEEPLRQAVEKTAVLQELRGPQVQGYYYSLTDRAPGPGEYKYVTQGTLLTGELMVIFTFLHRDLAMPEKSMVLAMLANATYAKTAP